MRYGQHGGGTEGTRLVPATSAASTAVPFAQRLTCTVAEACVATGLGRTKLYELIAEGHLDTIAIGRRRLVRVSSLLKLVDSCR